MKSQLNEANLIPIHTCNKSSFRNRDHAVASLVSTKSISYQKFHFQNFLLKSLSFLLIKGVRGFNNLFIIIMHSIRQFNALVNTAY